MSAVMRILLLLALLFAGSGAVMAESADSGVLLASSGERGEWQRPSTQGDDSERQWTRGSSGDQGSGGSRRESRREGAGERDMEEQPERQPGKVFRKRDADGNVIFTDRPPRGGEDGEEVEVRDPNRMPAGPAFRPAGEEAPEQEAFRYERLEIVSPEHEQNIHNPTEVQVEARVEPGLRPSHRLVLFKNGSEVEEGMLLDWPLRGEHNLQLRVLDKEGEVVQTSESITIFVHRASRLIN